MTKNRTFKSINYNGRVYNLLTLPNTNFFKFEIINKYGSHIERIYKERTGKNVFGISHFIEHLGFRATKDFDTATLLKLIKNGLGFSGLEWAYMLFGCAVAYGVSYFAIKFLMRYIKTHDFKVFGWYRIVLGAAVILYFVLAR